MCSVAGGPGQLLPTNGDLVALKNGNGGYVGGVKNNDKLLIVPHCQGWEHFYFETVDNAHFALKQKESGHYIGGNANHGEQPFLANNRQAFEILTYSILPNGMVTIINSKNNKLSKNGGNAQWSNATTLSESWNFEMIQKGNGTSSTGIINTNTGGINTSTLPAPGTVIGIESRLGGFIGKVREKKDKVRIAPKIQGWEKFIFESKGGKWAFKQQVSGLYLGGVFTNNGERVGLADACQGCETFTIEPRELGWFAIKSEGGTLLRKDGDNITWSHNNGNEEHWKFVPENAPIPSGGHGVANQQAWNQGQQGWNNQGQQQPGWNQGQQQPGWNQGQQQPGWNQGQQGGWNQGQQGWNNQGQQQPGWNQGQQGWDNQGQQGWNNQGQQSGGFVPDFLKNVQQHMHNSTTGGNPYQQQQPGNPFNSFQGGFSG